MKKDIIMIIMIIECRNAEKRFYESMLSTPV
mgnify:CR=1 FL=1